MEKVGGNQCTCPMSAVQKAENNSAEFSFQFKGDVFED